MRHFALEESFSSAAAENSALATLRFSMPTKASCPLFTVSHGVNFYPLVMKYLNNTISINSESEFKDKLREIFAAPHTLNVVHSILAQVRS